MAGVIHDLIFPKYCIVCHSEGEIICQKCLDGINRFNNYSCPVCKCKLPIPTVCQSCRNISYLDGLFSVGNYKDKTLVKIIETLKYKFVFELKSGLGVLIKDYLMERGNYFGDCVLVPVPLHRRRYQWRGFNQAEIIADLLGGEVNNKVLKRIKNNKQQAKLSAQDRKKGIKDIFRVDTNCQLKRVILVDDVYTTGATMQECAKMLKESGVKEVLGFVVARG